MNLEELEKDILESKEKYTLEDIENEVKKYCDENKIDLQQKDLFLNHFKKLYEYINNN